MLQKDKEDEDDKRKLKNQTCEVYDDFLLDRAVLADMFCPPANQRNQLVRGLFTLHIYLYHCGGRLQRSRSQFDGSGACHLTFSPGIRSSGFEPRKSHREKDSKRKGPLAQRKEVHRIKCLKANLLR